MTQKACFITFGSLDSPLSYDHLLGDDFQYRPQDAFYIHCYNTSISEIATYVQLAFGFSLEKSHFLIEENSHIKLITFTNYPSKNCKFKKNEKKLLVINTFSKFTMKWETNEFKSGIFRDLHGCNVSYDHNKQLDLSMSIAESLFSFKKDKSSSRFFTINEKIVSILASHLNFKVDPRYVAKNQYQISLRSLVVDTPKAYNDFLKLFDMLRPYLFMPVYLAVPVGMLYTDFEKLILPFDDTVWLWIGLTFVSAFTTIFILKFVKRRIRKFVIGGDVSIPSLNILSIVCGIGMTKLPTRNFARFLMIQFVLYCLIMRTAYQGMMFEFLQKDMRKPEVKSLEEMIEKNFTFYVTANDFEDQQEYFTPP